MLHTRMNRTRRKEGRTTNVFKQTAVTRLEPVDGGGLQTCFNETCGLLYTTHQAHARPPSRGESAEDQQHRE